MIHYENIETPIGNMVAGVDEYSVKHLWFADSQEVHDERNISHPIIATLSKQLYEYWNKDRMEFDIPIEPEGTDFQKSVWNEIRKLKFGETISYLDLSKRIGDVKAIRAVANANGKNPILLLIPCHRVIGTDNKLIGYSGGLERKQFLLDHESGQMNLFR